MSFVNVLFDLGPNQTERMEWDFIDTPPALAWQAATTRFDMEDVNPIDNYFCECDSDAEKMWDDLRVTMQRAGLKNKAISYHYRKLTTDIVNAVIVTVQNSTLPSEKFDSIAAMETLKHLSFWVNNAKMEKERKNEAVFGTIRFNHKTMVNFEPEWLDYMEYDIEYGTIYAQPVATKRSYMDLAFEDFSEIKESLLKKEFGIPDFLSVSFEIPFYDGYTGVYGKIMENLVKYKKEILYLDPDFDFDIALKSIGMIPVGRIKTTQNRRMASMTASESVSSMLGNIKGAKYLKKLETYD